MLYLDLPFFPRGGRLQKAQLWRLAPMPTSWCSQTRWKATPPQKMREATSSRKSISSWKPVSRRRILKWSLRFQNGRLPGCWASLWNPKSSTKALTLMCFLHLMPWVRLPRSEPLEEEEGFWGDGGRGGVEGKSRDLLISLGSSAPTGDTMTPTSCTCVHFHSHLSILMKARELPWWLSGRESTCRCRRCRFDPRVEPGRSPGGGNDNPLQSSCLENPVDRGAWKAAVYGVTESDVT